MPWIQLRVEVAGRQIEDTVQAMEEMGSQATTQENAGEDSYFDLAHPAEPKWDVQTVTGLFEGDASGRGEALVAELMQRLDFVRDVEMSQLEEQDWETAWLDQYRPIEITPDLWIYPSWVEADDQAGTVIRIDPGMAFGTGTHETTRLCMQVIAGRDLQGSSVLDYGCGSGILAITALKLGAADAVGVDIDPKAESVSRENAHNTGGASRFAIHSAQDVDARSFDIVIANILAFALIDLASNLVQHVKDDGMIVLSGILAHQAEEVIAAYQPQFEFARFEEAGWVALLGRKRRDSKP